MNSTESIQFTYWLRELPIAYDEYDDEESYSRVLLLGREYQLSAYDAVYLELAMRIGSIATLDQALRTAAKKAGIRLIT